MKRYDDYGKSELEKELEQLRAEEPEPAPERDAGMLRQELRIHQVELQIQNRDLREKQQEIQAALDRYADLYDFAPVGYLTLDHQGVIRNINLTGTDLLDRTRQNVIGKPLSVYLARESKPAFREALSQALGTGEERTAELALDLGRGARREVELRMTPHGEPADEVRVTMTDITERNRAQRKAREHREALLHAGRLSVLGELASGIAHEISQPVASIASYAQALQNLVRSGATRESELLDLTEKLAAQSERARTILERVRSFAGRGAPEYGEHDMAELAREAVALVEPQLRRCEIEVAVEADDVDRGIQVDRVQIIQVLVNLLNNAIEAVRSAASGHRRITVTLELPEPDTLHVSVADLGGGVDPAERERMFMPFHTTREEGLGLGLTLSESIVQAHGGRLWSEPNQPHGTVFRFTLPVGGRRGGPRDTGPAAAAGDND